LRPLSSFSCSLSSGWWRVRTPAPPPFGPFPNPLMHSERGPRTNPATTPLFSELHGSHDDHVAAAGPGGEPLRAPPAAPPGADDAHASNATPPAGAPAAPPPAVTGPGGLANELASQAAARPGSSPAAPRGPRNRGSGISANFLLGFQSYRAEDNAGAAGRARRGGRAGRSGPRRPQRPAAPFDRSLFVLANSRFLVSDASDFAAHGLDPDRSVDWGDVAQVTVLVPHDLQCPISLDTPPRCPQITPCGHVFSFSSIIQHLTTHDGPHAAPCPLCFAPLTAKDLRSASLAVAKPSAVGSPATVTLVRRARPDAPPQPMVTGVPALGGGLESDAPPPAAAFAKLTVTADPLPVWVADARALACEAAELQREGEADPSALAGLPFVQIAAEALGQRGRAWAERRAAILERRGLARLTSSLPSNSPPGAHSASETGAVLAAGRATREAIVSAFECHLSIAADRLAKDAAFPTLAPSAPVPVAHPTRARDSPWGKATAASVGPSCPSPDSSPPLADPWAGGVPGLALDNSDGAAEDGEGLALEGEAPGVVAVAATGADTAGIVNDAPGSDAASNAILGASDGASVRSGSDGGSEGGGAAARGGAARTAGGKRATQGRDRRPAPGPRLPAPPDGEWMFFQDASGQLAFVDSLSMRILVHHYGYYDALPESVTARVVGVEEVVIDADARKKLKFLSHLPLTSSVRLLELDLAPLLPPEALEPFADELSQRAARRARLARRERQEEEKARRAEAASRKARLGPSKAELDAMPTLPASRHAPPSWPLSGSPPAGSFDAPLPSPSPPNPARPAAPAGPGVSFARMAKMGLAASDDSGPSLRDLYGGGGAPVAANPRPAGAWGARPGGNAGVGGATGGARPEPVMPGSGGTGTGMVSLGSLPKAEDGVEKAEKAGAGKKGKGHGKGKGQLLFSIG